jgi:hypothetical protein
MQVDARNLSMLSCLHSSVLDEDFISISIKGKSAFLINGNRSKPNWKDDELIFDDYYSHMLICFCYNCCHKIINT